MTPTDPHEEAAIRDIAERHGFPASDDTYADALRAAYRAGRGDTLRPCDGTAPLIINITGNTDPGILKAVIAEVRARNPKPGDPR